MAIIGRWSMVESERFLRMRIVCLISPAAFQAMDNTRREGGPRAGVVAAVVRVEGRTKGTWPRRKGTCGRKGTRGDNPYGVNRLNAD